MREYTIQQFCLDFGILFYEEDVIPFAWNEGWLTNIDILDDEENEIETITILDEDAINDTLRRMHTDMHVETIGKTILY